jgi:hypothetical protein
MKKLTLLNIAFNLISTVIFVFLNMRAVKLQYEETFTAYALLYGIVMIVGNGLFVNFDKKS